MTRELKHAYHRAGKWSPDKIPSVPSETLQRFDQLFASQRDIKPLVEALKDTITGYGHLKAHRALKLRQKQPMPAFLATPEEMMSVRLTNISFLYCDEFGSIPARSLFQNMSEQRILAYKNDLSKNPEKIGLAQAYIRIASTAASTIRRYEWWTKDFAALVRKYHAHPDAVVSSIKTHGVVDERLIEAAIAGIHPALCEGSI